MKDKETIVISLGGSIVVQDEPDYSFILKFKNLIQNHIKLGKRFFIVVGGGKISRTYQSSLKNIIDANTEDLDKIGIYATYINAELLRLSLKEYTPNEIVTDPSVVSGLSNDVVIGAGWKSGCSTDTETILMAEELGIKRILNLSNVDYIYDSDPKVNPNAKKIENISWEEYRSIISDKWVPGMNLPFDPVASKMAEEYGIEVVFMSGTDIENLDSYLNNKDFIGSVIRV